MTTTTLDARARQYLDEVRAHLADLTDDERDDLVDDLASHLHEVSATDDRPLDEVLGSPAAFAAELRASADLPPEPPEPPVDGGDRGARPGPVARLRATVAGHPWTHELRSFLPELRPAWWVLRGLLPAYLLSGATGDGIGLVPTPFGSALLGVALAVGGAVVSVRRARQRPHQRLTRRQLALWGVVTLVVLLLVSVDATADDGRRADFTAAYGDGVEGPLDAGYGGGLIGADGRTISNIHAFDRNGERLDGVLLYDQDGQPIDMGSDLYDPFGDQIDTVFPVDESGVEVRNGYPLDQRVRTWDAQGRERAIAVRPPSVDVPTLADAEAGADADADAGADRPAGDEADAGTGGEADAGASDAERPGRTDTTTDTTTAPPQEAEGRS